MSTDDRMETITDPAEIRATDDPDERTTPAPVGAAVALDLDAAGPTVKRVLHIIFPTEAPDDEIERIEEAVVDVAYGAERGKWDTFAISHAGDCVADVHCAGRWKSRAEFAEAEVVTLRAKVAAVVDEYPHADTCGSMLTPGAGYPCSCWQADLRAALATTGEGQ